MWTVDLDNLVIISLTLTVLHTSSIYYKIANVICVTVKQYPATATDSS